LKKPTKKKSSSKKRKRDEAGEMLEEEELAKERDNKVGSGLKADHWKRILHMLPIALFNAWRIEGTDDIMDMTDEEISMRQTQADKRAAKRRKAADQARRESGQERSAFAAGDAQASEGKGSTEEMGVSMSRKRWYTVAVALCASLRALHAHYISY
jgi:hypothetical protein